MTPIRASAAAALLLISGCSATARQAGPFGADCPTRAWRVSFPPLTLDSHERIYGVELTVTNGRVVALNHIPGGWSLGVDPDYSDRPIVAGNAAHGADCLPSTDELNGFVTVCEVGSAERLQVAGTLITTVDFEATRDREIDAQP